jgi:hypothetical protein
MDTKKIKFLFRKFGYGFFKTLHIFKMRPAGLCPVGVDIQLPMVESDSDPRE